MLVCVYEADYDDPCVYLCVQFVQIVVQSRVAPSAADISTEKVLHSHQSLATSLLTQGCVAG